MPLLCNVYLPFIDSTQSRNVICDAPLVYSLKTLVRGYESIERNQIHSRRRFIRGLRDTSLTSE